MAIGTAIGRGLIETPQNAPIVLPKAIAIQEERLMDSADQLAQLDQRFIDIYEATRAKEVERQKQRALIVIQDDDVLLFRHERAMERFPGLRPPLYDKMKTMGHMPLGVFCLLYDQTGRPLDPALLDQLMDYRAAIEAASQALDTREQAKAGILLKASPIYTKVTGFLDSVIDAGTASEAALASFARSVGPDIEPLLAAAALAQLDACDAIIREIKETRLSQEQWAGLRVLVLGPYMARQGQLFLQYFSHLLDTPQQGDRRVIYYDGVDLAQAFDRLGTTILDAQASHAIFDEHDRLHRDVLADATTQYLTRLAKP